MLARKACKLANAPSAPKADVILGAAVTTSIYLAGRCNVRSAIGLSLRLHKVGNGHATCGVGHGDVDQELLATRSVDLNLVGADHIYSRLRQHVEHKDAKERRSAFSPTTMHQCTTTSWANNL